MPAGGFRTFIAGEVLDEDDINDYLMQGVLVFAGSAARGSAIGTAVEGQFSYLQDTNSTEYFDGTDWVPIATEPGAPTATGGNGTATSGGYTYHTFTSSGDFVVTDSGVVDLLIIGGGGGGGRDDGTAGSGGGGGGAGGIVNVQSIYVNAGTATVVVGAGGVAGVTSAEATNGDFSGFDSFTVPGGGAGGNSDVDQQYRINGRAGGSGGGGAFTIPGGVTVLDSGKNQGNNGGDGLTNNGGGGGGGAGGAGGTSVSDTGGAGGAGTDIYAAWASATSTGVSDFYAGGGGGAGDNTAGAAGSGGGGAGGTGANAATAGTANTGGGGGGGEDAAGGAGGSGLVIVRYAA